MSAAPSNVAAHLEPHKDALNAEEDSVASN